MMDAIVGYVSTAEYSGMFVYEEVLDAAGRDQLNELLEKFAGDRVLVTVQRLEERN